MTKQEVIEELNIVKRSGLTLAPSEVFDMAIRSLEAWDKVKQSIAEYLEEYNATDENGNHSQKWCAMKEAEMLINKHMKEVEE